MIFRRIGADITRNTSAAVSKTWSDSEKEGVTPLVLALGRAAEGACFVMFES